MASCDDGPMTSTGPIGRARRTIAGLVEATPPDRNRVVDAARAASIAVVVVWHWSLSITHRDADGVLVNPNPIAEIPAGWLPTWFLQVMPVFFVVGGFANRAGWCSNRRDGASAASFLTDRARRLLGPPLVFVLVWAAVDGIAFLLVDDHRSVIVTAPIVFVPLWFVGAYLWVVALVPVTARLHDRAPVATLLALAALVASVDVVRFGAGVDAAGLVNTALVWVLVHQLGYVWYDGSLRRLGPRALVGIAAAGVATLAMLTSLDAYPRSMVGTGGEPSHMYPTTAMIPVLAVVQLALLLAARPALERWLQRDRPWSVVVAVNAVIMTIFVWHMTALYAVVLVVEASGATLGSDPTLEWWMARPLWVLAPLIALVPLVALLARVETGRDDGRS